MGGGRFWVGEGEKACGLGGREKGNSKAGSRGLRLPVKAGQPGRSP